MNLTSIITSEKILFFDMDGTVVDTNAANNAAYKSAYYTIIGCHMSNMPNTRITRQTIKDISNISSTEYNAIVKEKERIYSNYLNLIRPIDYIIKLIQQYAGQNTMYLVTSSQRKRAIETLEHLDLLNCFKDIICSKSENKYKEAINILGVNSKDVVVFENDIIEIEKCKEVGISNNNIIKIMNAFQISPNDYLKTPINAWYYADYHGGVWKQKGTVENIICTLKNDIPPIKPANDVNLLDAAESLYKILYADLDYIKRCVPNTLTICVVPRAKVKYLPHQLYFKETIKKVVATLNLNDGTDYIIRNTDTRTTHRDKGGYGGVGALPYVGITKDTCTISNQVRGKDILLIDDVYTKTINIDEDAIQVLLDNGAERVFFYAIGRTI